MWRGYQKREARNRSALAAARERLTSIGRSLVDKIHKNSDRISQIRFELGQNSRNFDTLTLQSIEQTISRNERTRSDLNTQIVARQAHMGPFVELGAIRIENGQYKIAHKRHLEPHRKELLEVHVQEINTYIEGARDKLRGIDRDTPKLEARRDELRERLKTGAEERLASHGLPADPLSEGRPNASPAPVEHKKMGRIRRWIGPPESHMSKHESPTLQQSDFDVTAHQDPLSNPRSFSRNMEQARHYSARNKMEHQARNSSQGPK